MPENCEACAITALPMHRQLKVFQSNHEHFLRHHERQVLAKDQAGQVAKELADYEAEMKWARVGAEVELRDHTATRRGW
jgi:hypothetical protein